MKYPLIFIFFYITFGLAVEGEEPFSHLKETKSYTPNFVPYNIRIDGILDEGVWNDCHDISDFIQDEPTNLGNPSEETIVKIFYSNDAIFVGAQLRDLEPEKITKYMARRDGWRKVMMSDWFSVEIDSYHDHQTAFEFLVNSSGVQFDNMIFDDSFRNSEWNAVWESEVSQDENGWYVEMKIPFSILRFSRDSNITMGLNLNRYIQRKNELDSWVVSQRGQAGIVSKFGHLTGINISNVNEKPFSLKPFINSGYSIEDNQHLENQYKHDFGIRDSVNSGYKTSYGLDFKYLITQDMVADITINPDFGQIEADPADINLTYFETYFVEKRPFFMENATLFDTPIEVFYSRRIGTNRNYIKGNWQSKMDALVKYAGKLSGKTVNGLSFGSIAAITNDDHNSWGRSETNSTFLINRVTQDLFEGNSYLGYLGTHYKDAIMSSSVNSIDMLTYLNDNQLIIDWQYIHSRNQEDGHGLSFELSYNPSQYAVYSWMDFEYFDKDFNIDDVGYLYRNNLQKLRGGIGFYWSELDNPFFEDFRVDVSGVKSKNLDDLTIGNTQSLSSTATLKNFWYVGAKFASIGEHNDDMLLYDYFDMTLVSMMPIEQPKGTNTEFYFGNSQNDFYSVNVNTTYWNDKFEEGNYQSFYIGINPGEKFDLSFEYKNSTSTEDYRWLDIINVGSSEKYIFAHSDNEYEKYIYQMEYALSRKSNLQIYAEYYKNNNHFGQFYNYDGDSYNPIEKSDYYFTRDEIPFNGTNKVLNPQDHIYFYTKDQILNINFVFNCQYRPGSNFYLVYSLYRDVVGEDINSFSEFLKYSPSSTDLSEVNFTQSLFLKIDYWFNL